MFCERPSAKKSVPRWRWASLLLVLSFLYNPFSAAAASAGGLNVRHCASYRATVAASELQQLAPMADERTQLLTNALVVEAPVVLAEFHLQWSVPSAAEPFLPQKLFCSNLWFRPPPAF